MESVFQSLSQICWAPWLLLAAVSFQWADSAKSDDQQDPPNVILIMADDMGWGDTSYNGHRRLKTPGIDAMARNGLRLDRFYAAAPVCSPTRGSCLTGRHPFRYGVFFANTGHLKREEFTLAEYLKSKGYRTGHFGKWHLGTMTTKIKDSNRGGPANAKHYAPPNRHGFDHYFSTEAKTPTFDPLLRPAGKPRQTYWLPLELRSANLPYGTRYWENGREVKNDLTGDDSKIIMDRAIKFIEQDPSKKFFSVIWFHAPHLPVVASEPDRREFSDLTPYQQSYLGCIKALDRQVDLLRQKLRQLKIAGNTLICFCSDNGPEGNAQAPGSASNLRGRKRSLYEGGVRVPGIIEWPDRIQPGQVSNTVAVTSDYFPTIVDLMGSELTDRPIDGVSLVPVFNNPGYRRQQPVFFESRRIAAVMEQTYKLIVYLDPSGQISSRVELFDIETDPAESNDLSGKFPERVKSMTHSLKTWRASCKKSLAGSDY